jgi:RNA polymerase sigma factor (sigma-70 family)
VEQLGRERRPASRGSFVTRRISEGIAAEITQLFLGTAAELHAYACTLPNVDRHTADDLVQEAFQAAALAWEKLANRDTDGRRRWLFTVIRNKTIDQWRKERNSVLSPDLPEAPSAIDATADSVLSATALAKCWAAVQEMPAVRKKVAFLRWSEEWTSAEIAAWLGISQATVRGHLKVARDELMIRVGADVPFIGDPQIDEGG